MPIEGFKPYISKHAKSMHQPGDMSMIWVNGNTKYIRTYHTYPNFRWIPKNSHPWKDVYILNTHTPFTNMFGIQVKFPVCVCIYVVVTKLEFADIFLSEGEKLTPDLESEPHPGLFSVPLSGFSPSPEINSRVEDFIQILTQPVQTLDRHSAL